MADDLRENDPDLKYLSVERNAFNDPATQAEWTQKRLVWVPHDTQVNTRLPVASLCICVYVCRKNQVFFSFLDSGLRESRTLNTMYQNPKSKSNERSEFDLLLRVIVITVFDE